MSDDYICTVCGHRAGDHAVANRCIVDKCMCADDPYLVQLDALQAKLNIAKELIKRFRQWDVLWNSADKDCWHKTIDEVLAKLEEK